MSQAIAVREVTIKDSFGAVTCIQYKDFWAYVESKKMTREDIMKLKVERREEFFIKWKHGMTDQALNWEFEYSLRAFLKNFQNMSIEEVAPAFQDSLRIKREFDSYCDSIKQSIGIWTGKREIPKEVQDLADKVGGSVV